MRRITTFALIVFVMGQPPAFAADRPSAVAAAPAAPDIAPTVQKAIWQDAIEHEAARLAIAAERTEIYAAQQSSSQQRGWVQRHPVLFGAVVGAGLGAVSSIPRWTELYCAGGGDEDCLFHGGTGALFGTGAGAGVGALVGFLVRR